MQQFKAEEHERSNQYESEGILSFTSDRTKAQQTDKLQYRTFGCFQEQVRSAASTRLEDHAGLATQKGSIIQYRPC